MKTAFQRNVENLEKERLTYYSEASGKQQDKEEDRKLFINMSILQILQQLSQTVIDIINELTSGNATDTRSFIYTFFKGDRMIYIGLILLFISFSVYVIDITS